MIWLGTVEETKRIENYRTQVPFWTAWQFFVRVVWVTEDLRPELSRYKLAIAAKSFCGGVKLKLSD